MMKEFAQPGSSRALESFTREYAEAQGHQENLNHRLWPDRYRQACEFDYSGAQACKALRAEGYKVILVNSNPATIMTDPELAHRTYIEPLTKEYIEEIIAKEKPDALLRPWGGQTALKSCRRAFRRAASSKNTKWK